MAAETGPVIRLRRAMRLMLLVAVPLVAAGTALYLYSTGGREVETENAYVKANIVAVSAAVSGRVAEVAVRDNQAVPAGALLFKLDPEPFQIEVARARAQMDVVRTEVQSRRAEYRATLQEQAEARERIEFLVKQFERQERLREKGMTRLDTYEEARHNVDAARRRLEAVREKTNRVLAELSGNPNLQPEQHPRYAEAQAAHNAAMHDLARSEVKAPMGGVVSNMRLRVGEFVDKGVPVFSLIEDGPVWIEANFKETQLTHMRVGQPSIVVADAYPDTEWQGVVETIAPATGAEFAVLPPQNATGNWVKVVQRVPVRIRVQQDSASQWLRAGMTVTVSVDTGRPRGLPRMVQKLIENGWLPRFLAPESAVAGIPR